MATKLKLCDCDVELNSLINVAKLHISVTFARDEFFQKLQA